MDSNFLILLPNTNYQKFIFIWSLIAIVCLVITLASISFYHQIKQKLIKSSIQSISRLPKQTLQKCYQKDKQLTVSQVWDKFCSSLLHFVDKRDIDIHNIVKKMWKKDFLPRLYKWELNLEEQEELKTLILNLKIV